MTLETDNKTTKDTVKKFFSSPHFAVVGASTDPTKFGHKIFAWYKAHDIPATPINPNSSTVLDTATLPSLSALPNPKDTSVSIVTPPAATLNVLKEAQELGVPAVWLQPDTFDLKVLAEGGFKGEVVAGDGSRGSKRWCVLVHGEEGLKEAGKL